MEHMMRFEHELEYLLWLSPLLGVLLAVPTLEEACSNVLLWERPVLIEPAAVLRLYPDFVLTESSVKTGKWWTLLSHMFLHKDMGHLNSNLRGLLSNGLSAFSDLGVLGLYGVFLGSGVLSGLNSWGRGRQTEAQLQGSIPRAPERLGPVQVPERAREWWDSVRQGAARRAAPLVIARSEALGASGGVCGLMGYGLGDAVCRLWSYAGPRSFQQVVGALEESLRAHQLPGLLMSLLNIVSCGHFLAHEWKSARGDEGITGTDHTGHLTGFAAGAAMAIATFCMRKRHRRSAPDEPVRHRQQELSWSRTSRRFVNADGELVER
ncbi:unnamed protein product [Polarella glacialis]|uniref:Peptidase S54 rhomboid domain-containing protein n=1 Tax=Polarella glacialis TaxID=89957 RepID=A0A813JB26_POLGL|nr:unnamed protein product [Polarella glacialis]